MRSIFALLFCCGTLHAQALHTSAFTERLVTVPRPEPLALSYRIGADVAEPGVYEFAMSWIDKEGKTSPLSDPVTITATLRNWSIHARLGNYPVWTRAVGWVLWSRRVSAYTTTPPPGVSEYDWRPYGGQTHCNNSNTVTRPVLPICGWESHLIQAHPMHRSVLWWAGGCWPMFSDDAFWPKSATLGKPEIPPVVRIQEFPNKKHKVAISWACQYGETPLSDPLTIEQANIPLWHHQAGATNEQFACGDMIWRGESRPPQGALGIYVYVQWEGEKQWHRQQAPSGEGYLWGFLNYLPLANYSATNIPPSNTIGRSLISPLQAALEAGTGNVIVSSDQTIHCPIINPINNAHGTCIGRTITAPHGVAWKLKTAPGAEAWPMWVEGTIETKIINCHMESNTASVGVEFCGYTSSSCFYFSPKNLKINLYRPGYNAGIRQLAEAKSKTNHTCSEPYFDGLTIGAIHPIVCEGNQSANWLLKNVSITCNGGIESACISAHNQGTIQILERLVLAGSKESDADKFTGGRAIWANTSTLHAEIERVFVDQGFPAWFVVGGQYSPSIDMSLTQTNQWSSWIHVIESASGSKAGATRLRIKGEFSQHNNPMTSIAYSGKAGGIEIAKNDKLTLLQNLNIIVPIVMP